jgi:hypothetical protein
VKTEKQLSAFPEMTKQSLIIKLSVFAIIVLAFVINDKSVCYSQSVSGFIKGIGIHISDSQLNDGILMKEINAAEKAGITSLREDAPWEEIELEKGCFKIPQVLEVFVDSSIAHEINPLLILDYGNKFYDNGSKPVSHAAINAFVNYAKFVAEHFKGRVKLYEIWNEWPGMGEPPYDPQSYFNLVKAVYPVLKTIDSSITVLAGAVDGIALAKGWCTKLFATGIGVYSDGISIHPYVYFLKNRPSTPAALYNLIQVLEDSLGVLNNKRDVPLYITEIGWPSSLQQNGVSRLKQAAYISETYRLLSGLSFIKGIWWYDLKDDGVDPENNECNFGILDYDLNSKPAYDSLKVILKEISR